MYDNKEYNMVKNSFEKIAKTINNFNKTLTYTNKILSDQQKPKVEVIKDNNWISVDDLLPGVDHDWVLVKFEYVAKLKIGINDHYYIHSPIFMSKWNIVNKTWRSPFVGWAGESFFNTAAIPYKVTHWKPIDEEDLK